MENIIVFSEYLSELSKQGKHANVVVSFKNNYADFDLEEIRNNQTIIKSLIDAYRHEKNFSDAHVFFKELEIKFDSSKSNQVLNSYGWLLYYELDQYINEKSLENIQKVSPKILELIGAITFTDHYSNLLLERTLKKVFSIRHINSDVTLNLILNILTQLKFRTNKHIQDVIKKDVFIVQGIALALGRSGKPNRGFRFLEFLGFKLGNTLSEEILNSYGWLLYYQLKEEYKDISEDDPEEQLDTMFIDFDESNNNQDESRKEKEKLYNDLVSILTQLKKDSDYSPFSRLFNLYIKIQKKKASVNWRTILEFLQKIEPTDLSSNCPHVTFIKNGKEKNAELASDKENWYSTYANALFRTGDFPLCLEISEKALQEIERFHYNNDIWFARRIALCKKQLGDIDQAIKELERIVIRKREWFIQRELAELYFEKGNLPIAKKYALSAALNFGDKEKKDALFFLLGQIFQKEANFTLAHKHYLLTLMIRQEHGFRVPQQLKDALEETRSNGLNSLQTSAELFRELLKVWKTLVADGDEKNRKDGQIVKINAEKGFGFIRSENEEFYFKINSIQKNKNKANLKAKVSFLYKSPEEGKKSIAYDIHVL